MQNRTLKTLVESAYKSLREHIIIQSPCRETAVSDINVKDGFCDEA